MVFKKKSTSKQKRSSTKSRGTTNKTKTVKIGKQKITIKHQGSTRSACKEMGYSSGCDPRCLNKLEKRGGVWVKRASLAKALCKRSNK